MLSVRCSAVNGLSRKELRRMEVRRRRRAWRIRFMLAIFTMVFIFATPGGVYALGNPVGRGGIAMTKRLSYYSDEHLNRKAQTIKRVQTLVLGDYAVQEIQDFAGYSVRPYGGLTAHRQFVPVSEIQAWTLQRVYERGWDDNQFSCLVLLWNKESGWNPYATNRYSGAYGIPQALPGNKMRLAGDDWQTNPKTQVLWGLMYISARFGSPCNAWGHSVRKGWY